MSQQHNQQQADDVRTQIRILMAAKGVNSVTLAKLAGVHPVSVSRILHDPAYPRSLAEKLLDALQRL